MGIIKFFNSFSVQALGRFSIGMMALAVIISLGINFIVSNNINDLNNEWRENSESTLKKTSYLSFMRQSMGYGGMIHHFKNYVLRGKSDDLVEANFHILEIRTFISAYSLAGISPEETRSLAVLEQGVNKYFYALKAAEQFKREGLSVAQIDQAVIVDDTSAFQALLILERILFEERLQRQLGLSENVQELTSFSLYSSIVETVFIAILFLLIVWVFRRRIVALYAREVTERRKNHEERIKIDTMVNSISEGLVTIDKMGQILTVNDAILEMYGYERDKLIGQNVKMLVPAPHFAKHDEYLNNYLTTGQAKIIGKARELESIRANNASFPIDLNVSEMEVGGERQFVGIIRDVTDRKAADRAKKHFIATVSHELRTPLTAIQGALGMVNTGVLGVVPDKIEGLIGVALNNTKRLVSLVNDLLDLEKLDAGQMSFDYSEQPLAEIIGNAYYANLPYADKYGIKLNLTGKGRGLNVWADPKRIEQVITNLLSNAIKFSPEGGTVTINFVKNKDVARVEVIDKGAGISDDFRNVIFKRFSQADNSDTKSKGGTGLGLSISKVIVENHGGQIGFLSKAGEGSTFYFELPTYEKQKKDKVSLNPEYLKRKVLIVEDADPNAAKLSKNMRDYGFSPISVSNIAQARNQMHSSPIDTLIVDLDQAGLGKSLDLVENIRINKPRSSFPIVFLSEEIDQLKSDASSSRFDVNLWLRKPFMIGDFLTELDDIIQSSVTVKQKILLIDGDDGFTIRFKKHVENVASVTIASSLVEAKLCYDHIDFNLFIIDPETVEGKVSSLYNDLDKKAKESEFRIIHYSMKKNPKRIKAKNSLIFNKANHSFNEFLNSVKEIIVNSSEKK